MTCFSYGLRILNATELYTIMYLSPIFTLILSVFILREKVKFIDILYISIAFLGCILVIKPSFLF